MKKFILMGLLALGIGAPSIHGKSLTETILDVAKDSLTLVNKAPTVATNVQRNANTLKTAVTSKKPIDAVNALEQILSNTTILLEPTANLISAIAEIPPIAKLDKKKGGKIASGVQKMKSIVVSIKDASGQFTGLVNMIKELTEAEKELGDLEINEEDLV